MPLTQQTQSVLEAMLQAGLKPIDTLTPVEARAQFAAMIAARRSTVTPVARTEDRLMTANGRDTPMRLYWPMRLDWPGRPGPLPAIIYFHGGGHVIGNIDTHDEVTRAYCASADGLVISVDYAKGPEHKFPAAVEDVRAVIDWLHANAAALNVEIGRRRVGKECA